MIALPTSRRNFLIGSTAAALTPVGAIAASAQVGAATASQAERVAQDLMAANAVPALSLAIARSGELLWAKAFGTADLEFDIAADPSHVFRLGSVGKVVAATAAVRLAARGAIDLHAPISRVLPDLPAQHRATTLLQLLTHRGGVRHYDQALDYAPSRPGGSIDQHNYLTSQDVLDIFINDPLATPVGSQVLYSTYGYTLASVAIEKAVGQAFPEILKTEIGDHFDLPSLQEDDPFAVKAKRVRGYALARQMRSSDPRLEGGWANTRQNNNAYKWAGGGLLMTPSDLARFGAAHLEGADARIDAAQRALLFTPQTEATRSSPPLGIGWRVDRDAQQRPRWHHAGGQDGCRACLIVYPSLGLSVALATNATGTPGDVLTPAGALADLFSA